MKPRRRNYSPFVMWLAWFGILIVWTLLVIGVLEIAKLLQVIP